MRWVRGVRFVVNGFMMLFGIGVVAGLVTCSVTLHDVGSRVIVAAIAVMVTVSLLTIVSKWWVGLRSRRLRA